MDDDAAQLRERVDKLEQIAAKQQETIEELEQQSLLGSWGRRGVLGGIAAALGIASASGSAAAGVGQVGTQSERVDAVLDTVDANSATVSGTTTTGTLEADEGSINQNRIVKNLTGFNNISIFGHEGTTLDVSGQMTTPKNLNFRPDGSSLYLTGGGNSEVYQYDLSTNWDISTASFTTSYSDSRLTSAYGISFNNDGTKIYVTDIDDGTIVSSSLSTAYDLTSTISNVNDVDFSSEDNHPLDLTWVQGGNRAITHGGINDKVFLYDASTNYDISTFGLEKSRGAAFISGSTKSGKVGPNGHSIYVTDRGASYAAQSVHLFKIERSGDFSSAGGLEYSGYLAVEDDINSLNGSYMRPNGRQLFNIDGNNDTLYQYDV